MVDHRRMASRIFPTTCVQRCNVTQVSAQSERRRPGQSLGLDWAIWRAMLGTLVNTVSIPAVSGKLRAPLAIVWSFDGRAE